MTDTAKEKIPWIRTKHSSVTHLAYIARGEQLWVAYGSGNVYRFVGVPKRWYNDLVKAQKPAQYIQKHMKGSFEMRRLYGFKPTI